MVSKRNYSVRLSRDGQKVTHYSLKKLSVGLASVAVGTGLFFAENHAVYAEEVSNTEAAFNEEAIFPSINVEEFAKPMTVALDNEEVAAPENETVILKLSDYHVDPTGYKDSGQGIYNALQAAKELSQQGKHVTLEFDQGSYTIQKEHSQVREVHTSNTSSVDFPRKHIGVLVEGINNLTIDGKDSDLIVEGDLMALGIFQSENVTVKNLKWDYRTPSTSEMTVFDFDKTKGTVDYFIPKYFDYEVQGNRVVWKGEKDSKGNPYWTAINEHNNYGISVKYPTEKMGRAYYPNQGPFQNVRNIQKLENGLLRVTYNGATSPIEPVKGMNYQLVANTVRPTSGALVWESKDVNIENVKMSYMHGFGFLVQMSENVTFDGIRMESDIRTGKNTASYADGIHVSGVKGKITVKNSFFNNTHDDPINIHGTFTRVEEKVNNKTLRLNYIHKQQGGFQQFYKGDKVVFYSRDTLESRDNERTFTVKSVQGPSKTNLKSMIVEFEEDVPDYLLERIGNEPKFVAENITYTPEVDILNNEFINVFTRHILVTSRKKVKIDGNKFEASTMPATFFSNDSDEWYESGPIRDLEITNNTFNIRSIGRTWWKYSPAIYFHPVTKGGQFPSSDNPIHKNILIKGNTFYLESDGALRAESVENLRFVDNKIYRLNPNIQLQLEASNLKVNETKTVTLTKTGNVVNAPSSLPGGPERNAGSVANVLEFEKSKNVTIENNVYDDGLKRNVLVEGMKETDYAIKDDLNILKTRAQIQPSAPVGKVYYVSSNPRVATINEKGEITAHQLGTTEVYAYTVWNGTIIKSNTQTVTVNQSAMQQALPLDERVFAVTENTKAINLKSNGKLLSSKDVTFESLAPNIVTFTNGVPTVHQTGIAPIRVQHNQQESTIYFVANHTASQMMRAEHFTVENENNRMTVDSNEIRIQRNGGEDLWQNSNGLNNLVRFSLDGIDKDNFAASIHLKGLPVRQANSWDSSYFMLFKLKADGTVDRDNYLSVGKRAHADGFGTVREENQRGSEGQTGRTDENNTTDMTFVIEKAGKVVRLYSVANNEYKLIQEHPDATFLGNQLALGVGGWGSTQENRMLILSEFKVISGNKESLATATIKPFKVADTTNAEVSNIRLTNGTLQADNAQTLHTIIIKDDKATLQGSELQFTEAGEHLVYVVNESANGKLSMPQRFTHHVNVNQITKMIHQTELNGDITLDIPTDLIYVVYQDGSKDEVIDVHNQTSIVRDGHTIRLNRIASNHTQITGITTSLGNVDMTQAHQFIRTDASDKQIAITINVSDTTARTVIRIPDHQIEYVVTPNQPINVPIYNGVNNLEVISYAADGVTTDIRHLHVLRNHSIEPGVRMVTVAGENVDVTHTTFKAKKVSDLIVTPNASNAIVSYHVLEQDNHHARVLVKIEHEDKLSVEYKEYTLNFEAEKVTEPKEGRANYSGVYAAMRRLPKDLSQTKPTDWANILDRVAEVELGKKESEQSVVDEYARKIENAVQLLSKISQGRAKVDPLPVVLPISQPTAFRRAPLSGQDLGQLLKKLPKWKNKALYIPRTRISVTINKRIIR